MTKTTMLSLRLKRTPHDHRLVTSAVLLSALLVLPFCRASAADCIPPPGLCNLFGVVADPCMRLCPQPDQVFTVTILDSCGAPACIPERLWLDLNGCGSLPCEENRPGWPLVFADSCDPATGAHYFTAAAHNVGCFNCEASVVIDGIVCETVPVRFLDVDGDMCVTQDDMMNQPCNDYDCDGGVVSVADLVFHIRHIGHCCWPCTCPYQSDFDADGFITAIDLSFMTDILFAGTPDTQDPQCPANRADFDCDGFATALDLASLTDHLFSGGPAPCNPCLCVPVYPDDCPPWP